VYVQRDKADGSDNADKVLALLTEQRFDVAGQVESIPTDKMPTLAQVRYFNASDEAVADKALAILRQIYPSAAKLFVGLKAPKGQLEVWLPKAGSEKQAAANKRAAMMAAERVTH
jgi:hypothetical protein